jgi:hypothetical protein
VGTIINKDIISSYNIENLIIPNNSQYEYHFSNTYTLYAESNWLDGIKEPITGNYNQVEDFEYVVNSTDKDIVIWPNYDSIEREVTVVFYSENVELGSKTLSWGSAAKKFYPDKIPYKDDSKLSLYTAYNFIGYGISNEAEDLTVISEERRIEENISLYAKFELIPDIRNIIHPEYFMIVEDRGSEGVVIGPADSRVLAGKITIPNEFDGRKVIGIRNF